jgi:hypothetical protein
MSCARRTAPSAAQRRRSPWRREEGDVTDMLIVTVSWMILVDQIIIWTLFINAPLSILPSATIIEDPWLLSGHPAHSCC